MSEAPAVETRPHRGDGRIHPDAGHQHVRSCFGQEQGVAVQALERSGDVYRATAEKYAVCIRGIGAKTEIDYYGEPGASLLYPPDSLEERVRRGPCSPREGITGLIGRIHDDVPYPGAVPL